jgi:D-3-phosphoglycerate dehydrogenase / 2-oxoglutarate reductase
MNVAEGDPPRVVITDCDHLNIEPELRVFEEAGIEVVLANCRDTLSVIRQAGDADALINQYVPIDEAVLESLERCRVVVRYGVGVDSIDLEAAARRGIWVANVPDYGTEEVSDHALALVMSLLRGVNRLDRAVRGGSWDVKLVRPLRRVRGLTLGVVGCGKIGAALARKAACLGLRILVSDAVEIPDALLEGGIRQVDLDELLGAADVVSLHAPLTEDTHYMIGAEQLRRMKRGSYLINTARGGLVDSVALLQALEREEIAGAALDVLENEPPEQGDPLVMHERVIVTPHAGWYSEESYEALKSGAASEVVRVLSGKPPCHPVNTPEGGKGG